MRSHGSRGDGALSLLSGVLHGFTLDVESEARTALAISANTLRVLTTSGTRIGDLPRLTGVSREANAMCAGWLERQACAVTEPDPTASRGRLLRLTPKGRKAQQSARRVLDTTEMAWRTRFGSVVMADLTAVLEQIVGDGSFSGSPLAPGLVPYDGTWRAALRRPEALPHHPMVLHRGGYPDGS